MSVRALLRSFFQRVSQALVVSVVLLVLVFLFLVAAGSAQSGNNPIIVTVAGNGLPAATPATSLGIGNGAGIAIDPFGNLLIADGANYVIRKVDPHGNLTVVAGNGASSWPLDAGFDNKNYGPPGHVGDGGAAVNAQFAFPSDVTADSIGDFFINDDSSIIRKVDFNGIISSVAGTGIFGFTGDGGPATSAEIGVASQIASDAAGNLYFANNVQVSINSSCGAVIRKISASGTINTVAGNGTCGFSGDGGPATSAQIEADGVAVDSSGAIYISDSNSNRIRKVSTSGVINTIAGTGTCGYSGDGGPALNAQICPTYALAVDVHGNIYFAQGFANVRKIDTNGVITTVAGNGTQGYTGDGGPATSAEIEAEFVAADSTGNLFIGSGSTALLGTGGIVRKVNSIGVISTFAGNGTLGFSGDNKSATATQIANPSGVAVDGSGDLYIGDWNNFRIRKVNTAGQIATIAGTGMPCFSQNQCGTSGPAVNANMGSAAGVTFDAVGNLYFAESYYGCNCIKKVDSGGNISIFAGGGTSGLGDGGPATSATLSSPLGLAFDSSGNLYISDYYDYRIRRVDTNGIITTIVGNGTAGFSGDGGPASGAQVTSPTGLTFDGAGNMYIGDGPRLRRVDKNGVITTFAGNGTSGFSGDGGPATSAELAVVDGVSVDKTGNVYIADGNNRVRKVDTNGVISTFAGTGTLGFSGDGGPAINAQLSHPGALAFDGNGNLFVGDVFNYRVRAIVVNGSGQRYLMSVTKAGSGAVTSGDGAINCGSVCSANYASGSTVTLTATSAQGWVFASWSGCDTTQGDDCTVTMNNARNVAATFFATLFVLTTGSGTVASGDGAINCGTVCSANYAPGTAVTLTASPAQSWAFTGWMGCDIAQGNVCTVRMNNWRGVSATFKPSYSLSVSTTGSGIITSSDLYIDCGSSCSHNYPSGTQVVLTATPGVGSTFTSWTGCNWTQANTCAVTMLNARSVTANFSAAHIGLSSLQFKPSTVRGGQISVGTLTLAAAAPSGGVTVGLKSSQPGTVYVPAIIYIPGGRITANFPARVIAGRRQTVTVTAVAGSAPVSGSLNVLP